MTPSCTSHMCSHTSSRNQRSCVTTKRAPVPSGQRRFRWLASQVMACMSRWLVGSSMRMTSQVPTSTRAKSARRRWPPESSPTVPRRSMSAMSSSRMLRTLGSDAHTYSGSSPKMACTTVSLSASSSAWPTMPTVMPLRQVTLPSSGVTWRAMSCSRVDLPSPLRPTMPMRSPSFMPMVWSSRTFLPGHSCERCSQPMRIPKACYSSSPLGAASRL